MRDYGRRDRMIFLHRPQSRAFWIFVAAVIGLSIDYWIRH